MNFKILHYVGQFSYLNSILAQGTANPKYAGSLTSLTQLASTIEPGKGDPVIMFEGQEK